MNNRKLTINWGGTEDTNIPTMQPRADRTIRDQARSNVFTRFRGNDTMIENQKSVVSSGMWSTGTGELTSFYTSSTQSGSTGQYFYDVYHEDPSASTAAVQFAVSYGDYRGSGSVLTHEGTDNSPSKAMYSQMAQVFLPPSDLTFDFDTYDGEYIYSLVVQRARLREKMDPGNWELHLQSGSGTDADTISLIDDSGANANAQIGSSKREFNVVSGSVLNGVHTTATATATATSSGSYGLFYPESGIIILNPNSLQSGSGYDNSQGYIEPVGTSADSNDLNHRKLFNSIKSGSYFSARREEQKRSSMYFCSVRANEYNHSQNPSFFTGDNAQLVNSSFIREPNTYITTVGLYNENNELLAVAKLSRPFKKDSNTEALIKVRLDY